MMMRATAMSTCAARAGLAARPPFCRTPRTRCRTALAQATASTDALVAALADLEATRKNPDSSEEAVAAKLAQAEELAKSLGADKVAPEQTEGYFSVTVINGPLRRIGQPDTTVTLAALSGGAIPAGVKLAYNQEARTRAFTRGLVDGLPTHIAPTSIQLAEEPRVWGLYEMRMDLQLNREGDPEASRRTWMKLREVVLTPDFAADAADELMPKWLELLGAPAAAAGASVDQETGEIRAPVRVLVETHLDVVAAAPGWMMYVSGKSGSYTLYRAIDSPFADS